MLSRALSVQGHWFLLLDCLAIILGDDSGVYGTGDWQGPVFIFEPPPRVDFSNSAGSRLDCRVKGTPLPTIHWLLADNTPAITVPGLRYQLNESLAFPAFNAAQFRPDVHRTTYRCVATNDLGRIQSRDVRLRAVVMQEFAVTATSDSVTRGNCAVLRCVVPSFARDYITVTSWLQDHNFNIYPSSDGDGKFHMLPTGELVIVNAANADGYSSYQCRVTHRLSGETKISFGASRVTVTEPISETAPVFLERLLSIEMRRDELVVLPCLAQGHPTPNYRWEVGGAPLSEDDQRYTSGGLLIIPRARDSDTARYRCEAFNSAGRALLEIALLVTSPLSAHLSPTLMTVALGQPAQFSCKTGGQPITNILWAKDGQILSAIRGGSGEVLRLPAVSRDDQGMYQCFVKNEHDMAQSTAELRLGDTPPHLVYRFIRQSIQPGPSISLKCVASGNPTPNVKWTLDGFPLPQSERFVIGQYVPAHGDVISHVNITSVRVEDGGMYECIAVNRIGETSHSAELNVYGPPHVRSMGEISAVAGETLRVTCPVAGYPIDVVKWYRDDRLLPINRRHVVFPNGSLVIENIQSIEDGGGYKCVVANKQGLTASGMAQINVMVPPKITPFSFRMDLHLGERVGVQCVVSKGDPPLSVHWLKDGLELSKEDDSLVERSLDEFTSVLSISALARSHGGNYTCVARNAAALDAHSASLSVNVPPAITPFSFGELSSGERVRVTCSVKRGDPPISISWLKNDRPLLPTPTFTQHDGLDLTLQDVEEFSSVLAIRSVSSRHSGNYTCVARNSARTTMHTAQLLVTVPPTWLVEPQNAAAKLGQRAVLDCKVEGFPQPTIAWKKASDYKPGQYEDLLSHGLKKQTLNMDSGGLELLSNGSLQIERVNEADEGSYLCEASNGIGVGLSAVVRLTVHAPVHFKVRSRKELVRHGSSAVLKCQAMGDLPITLTWRKEGSVIELQGRTSIKNTTALDGLVSELTVREVRKEDGGVYTCFARNEYGHDQTAMHLLVQDTPAMPTNVHVLNRGSRRLSIAWTHAQDGNSPISRYLVRYSRTQESWQGGVSKELGVEGSHNNVILESLQPATLYIIHVIAENAVGPGITSRELKVQTEEEAPSAAPHHVNVEATSSTQLVITFEAPSEDQRNGALLGYYVGQREMGETDGKRQFNFTTLPWSGKEKEEARLDELKKFCKYGLVVQAFNSRGPGPLSEEVIAQTLEAVPEAPPRDVRCTAVSPESLQVSWQPPPDTLVHGVIQGYKLLYEPVLHSHVHGSDVLEPQTKMTTALTTMLHGLTKFTNYSIELLAFTRVGDGIRSPRVHCCTKEDVPGPPGGIKALLKSLDTALVTWLPPTQPNGIILKYTVYVRIVDNGHQVDMRSIPHLSTSQLQYELPGLKKKLRYEFRVTAFTKVGEGQGSPVTALSPANKVSAGIVSFGGIHVAAWKSDIRLPCRAVGVPEPTRQWMWGEEILGQQPRIGVLSDGALLLSGAQRSDQGEYTCMVSNQHGKDLIIYHLLIQVPPGAPLLLMTGNTPNSLQLQWKLGDDGGSPIRGFVIHFKLEHGEWEEVRVEGMRWTHTLTNLRCGTAYHVYATAHNRIGSGPPSTTLAVRTRGGLPQLPAPSDLLVVNSSGVGLRLNAWPDSGCRMLYFVVEYASNNLDNWVIVGNNIGSDKMFELVGLILGTTYRLRITAHNAAGSSLANYRFTTLNAHGGTVSPSHVMPEPDQNPPFHKDAKMVVMSLVSVSALALSLCGICFCLKKKVRVSSSPNASLQDVQSNANQDNKHNLARREQYYATVRKLPPSPANLECIPEYTEDIRPYATFHVPGPRSSSESSKLQTFVYRENDTSPTKKFVKSEYCRVKKGLTNDEYDSFGSESDTEPGTSSRTESYDGMTRLKRGDWSPPPDGSPGTESRPTFPARYCQAHLLK